jgi:hypothetical protein
MGWFGLIGVEVEVECEMSSGVVVCLILVLIEFCSGWGGEGLGWVDGVGWWFGGVCLGEYKGEEMGEEIGRGRVYGRRRSGEAARLL